VWQRGQGHLQYRNVRPYWQQVYINSNRCLNFS